MKPTIKDEHLPITIEQQDTSFECFRKVITYTYREDESGLSATRELVAAHDAVAVVVFDPRLKKLVLIRQFRLGAQLGTGKGMSVEFPAGLIDPGEDPIDTARRELLEETGLHATRLEPLCSFLTTPGVTDEVLHLYYAEADATKLQSKSGLASETEQTFPFLTSFEEAMAAVDDNQIQNGIVILGLMWFARHRAKLESSA